MAESHDDQDETESDKSVARPQTQYDQSSGAEFDQRDNDADQPEGPDGQKCIGEWQEIFSGVLERSQLKHFPEAGHEEDQAENESREE